MYNGLPLEKGFLSVPFRMQRSGAAPPISASLNEREVLFVFAVIETGGKQYKVSEGDIVFIEKLSNEEGSEVVFENVKALSAEDGLKVGTPVVAGARVTANVLKTVRVPRSTSSSTNPRKTRRRRSDTDSPTPRSR